MFKQDATEQERRITARVLDAEFLPVVIQRLVRMQDVASLRIFHEEDRFRFTLQEVFDPRKKPHAILQEGAVQVVDALAAVVFDKRMEGFDVKHPNPAAEPGTRVHPVVHASQELRDFIVQVCMEAIHRLDILHHQVAKERTMNAMLGKTREHTLDVIAGIACMFDDPALWKAAEAGSPQREHGLVSLAKVDERLGERCSLTGLALHFESLKVLDLMPAAMFDEPNGDTPWSLDQGAFLAHRSDRTSHTPSPAAMALLLDKMHDELEVATGLHETGLGGDFLDRVCGGSWGYLLDTVIEKQPSIFRLETGVAEIFAAKRALPSLLQLLAPQMSMPDGLEYDGTLRRGHPVAHLLDSLEHDQERNMQADPDASLRILLAEMQGRERLADALAMRVKGHRGDRLGHACARHGLETSLVFLADRGLDLEARNTAGQSLEDCAGQGGQAKAIALLRSLRAQRAAADALSIPGLSPQ